MFCSQTICDIHYQLTFVEQTSNEEAVRVACRSAQVALLNAQLDRLEERLGDSSAPHNKYANYFTTGEHAAHYAPYRVAGIEPATARRSFTTH